MAFQHTGNVALTKVITLVKTALKGKVDTVEGKGLSTNDLTNELVEQINNAQNAEQVESAITGKGYQTSEQVESAITGKGYQTSEQVETAITEKGYQNAAQVETAITAKGYQTAEQVAAAVANADHVKRVIVNNTDEIDLTAENADQFIYMVKKSSTKSGDKYDEYMVFDGELEKVGDWQVDLSGYVKTDDITDMTAEEVQTLWDSVTV